MHTFMLVVCTAVVSVVLALVIQQYRSNELYRSNGKSTINAASIAEKRVPQLYRHVDVAIEYRRRIDPIRVKEKFIPHVRLQPSPVFVLRAGEPSERDPPLNISLPKGLVTEQFVRISAFLKAPTKDYVYATLSLDEWPDEKESFVGSEESWCSVLGIDDPGVDRALKSNSSSKNLSTAMLWISQRGVVAGLHYDVSHNFLTQLRGTKRVELWWPESHENLHFFPRLHRARQQSQKIQSIGQIPPNFVFDLIPGDVLYIPPYWSHRVNTTSSGSLSLSVISPSSEDFAGQRAFAVGAPLTKCQNSTTTRAVAVQVFLVHLISRLPGFESPAQAAQRLLNARYLYAFNRMEDNDLCAKNDPDAHKTARACLSPHAVIDHVDAIAKHLTTTLPPPISDIFLFDYVEDLIAWAVGPKLAAHYIRTCLDFGKLQFLDSEFQPMQHDKAIFSI